MKRFWAVFGLILLFMAVWAIILSAVILGFELNEDDETALLVMFPMMFLIFLTFLPYLNKAIGWAYRFKGEGDPIPEKELRKRIIEINEYDVPVMVLQKRKKLIVTWKYVDAKWYGIIVKAGLQSVYELHIKIKPKSGMVKLIDVHKKVKWSIAPDKVSVSGGYFRGVMMHYEISKLWGWDENFKFRKMHDYKFSPSEIKNPVLNSILRAGWNVKFGMW